MRIVNSDAMQTECKKFYITRMQSLKGRIMVILLETYTSLFVNVLENCD